MTSANVGIELLIFAMLSSMPDGSERLLSLFRSPSMFNVGMLPELPPKTLGMLLRAPMMTRQTRMAKNIPAALPRRALMAVYASVRRMGHSKEVRLNSL